MTSSKRALEWIDALPGVLEAQKHALQRLHALVAGDERLRVLTLGGGERRGISGFRRDERLRPTGGRRAARAAPASNGYVTARIARR